VKTDDQREAARQQPWLLLAEISATSVAGTEACCVRGTMEAVQALGLSAECLERLRQAVCEAAAMVTLPAGEAGVVPPIVMRVLVSYRAGPRPGEQNSGWAAVSTGPLRAVETPNRRAEPARPRAPGGWGFFLIRRAGTRRDPQVYRAARRPAIELFLYREGSQG
jgi:hypothetical protein